MFYSYIHSELESTETESESGKLSLSGRIFSATIHSNPYVNVAQNTLGAVQDYHNGKSVSDILKQRFDIRTLFIMNILICCCNCILFRTTQAIDDQVSGFELQYIEDRLKSQTFYDKNDT